MKQLSINELHAELAHIDELLIGEDEIVVTRSGAPIARILPVKVSTKISSHADLRARGPRLELESEEYIHADRDGY